MKREPLRVDVKTQETETEEGDWIIIDPPPGPPTA